jgi:hypothetical protein
MLLLRQSPAQQSPAQQSPAQQSPAQQSPAQQSPAQLSPGRRRRSVRPWAVAVVAASGAALMAADAWFDVCTSPAGRPLALAIMDMIIEAGVAATCLLLPRMARPAAN